MKRLFHYLVIFVILFSGCSGFSKKYTIAIDPFFYPANLGGQADNVYGFTVDLIKEVAQLEGLRLSYVTAGSESLLSGLQRDSYDAVITPKSNIVVESSIYASSKNFFLTGPVLVAPVNSKYDKLSQMQSKIVGVVDQSDAFYLAQKYPKVIVYSYSSPAYVLEALKYSFVDSAFLDVMVARAFVSNLYQGIFEITSKPLSDEGLCLVMMINQDPFLIEAFDRGIKKAKRRGIYKRLMQKWNLYPQAAKDPRK